MLATCNFSVHLRLVVVDLRNFALNSLTFSPGRSNSSFLFSTSFLLRASSSGVLRNVEEVDGACCHNIPGIAEDIKTFTRSLSSCLWCRIFAIELCKFRLKKGIMYGFIFCVTIWLYGSLHWLRNLKVGPPVDYISHLGSQTLSLSAPTLPSVHPFLARPHGAISRSEVNPTLSPSVGFSLLPPSLQSALLFLPLFPPKNLQILAIIFFFQIPCS